MAVRPLLAASGAVHLCVARCRCTSLILGGSIACCKQMMDAIRMILHQGGRTSLRFKASSRCLARSCRHTQSYHHRFAWLDSRHHVVACMAGNCCASEDAATAVVPAGAMSDALAVRTRPAHGHMGLLSTTVRALLSMIVPAHCPYLQFADLCTLCIQRHLQAVQMQAAALGKSLTWQAVSLQSSAGNALASPNLA